MASFLSMFWIEKKNSIFIITVLIKSWSCIKLKMANLYTQSSQNVIYITRMYNCVMYCHKSDDFVIFWFFLVKNPDNLWWNLCRVHLEEISAKVITGQIGIYDKTVILSHDCLLCQKKWKKLKSTFQRNYTSHTKTICSHWMFMSPVCNPLPYYYVWNGESSTKYIVQLSS